MQYTPQQTTGVSILVVASILSLISVVGLLCAVALSAWNTRRSEDRFLFVRTHAAAYFVSLMICWVLQCIGSIMNTHWLRESAIFSGSLCTAQGVLKHIADVGAATWTLVMAANTFSHLFLDFESKDYVLWIVLLAGWSFTGMVVGIGHATNKTRGPFYDVNGVWCWISSDYKAQLATLGYMIILLSALFSAILYILTFLHLRGNLTRVGWKVRLGRVQDSADKYFANDRTKLVAQQMLLFPVAYGILVFPIAITRFITWSGKQVPFELTVFSACMYTLSGLTNVILFTATRRILPLSSMRIGDWYLVPSSRGASNDVFDASDDKAEKGASKTVAFMTHPTTIPTPPGRKQFRRPSELDLSNNRDSFASMYSAREGVYIPPLSSHWSPNTPPLQQSSRLSVYLQNISTVAAKI